MPQIYEKNGFITEFLSLSLELGLNHGNKSTMYTSKYTICNLSPLREKGSTKTAQFFRNSYEYVQQQFL